jgi:predicted negative regulator of RcsB-dependent stress response
MSTHYDDEAQVEDLRRWIKENWKPLAGGIVLGLAAIFGWEAFTRYRDAHRADGAQLFEALKNDANANKYEDAVKVADRLTQEFGNTPYAVAGALKVAQTAVVVGKLDDARTRLEWALAHDDDPALKPLIQFRLASVLWQLGKPEDALKQISGDAGAYAGLYAELQGDIKLAQGDRAAARSAYEQALEKFDPKGNPAGKETLQQKLDDLADVAPVHS